MNYIDNHDICNSSLLTPKTPKWIFLDIDDTLWDFEGNSLSALKALYENTPLLNSLFEGFDSFLSIYRHHNHLLWNDFALGKIEASVLKRERFIRAFREVSDIVPDENTCNEINARYLAMLCMQTKLVEGAVELLESLKDRYMLAALSNGFSDTQYKKLYNTPLWRYISRMVVSAELGINKPAREIFDFALDAVGAEAETTLMIGDNPATDIAGALNAGWMAIYYNPRNTPISDKSISDNPRFLGEVTSLRDIENLIDV